MSQVRGVVSLFVVSYLIQAMLLVNSAETELHNNQQPVGALLATELANSAAPLIINKDSVGLGLLANRFGETDAILSLRVINTSQQVIATGGSAQSQQGRAYSQPIILENLKLGSAEVVLANPVRGDIIRHSALNLALSLMIHVFMALWFGWPQLFRNIRIPILQPLPEDKPVNAEPAPSPVIEAAPEPIKPAASVLVLFNFDDRKNLMQKVNASTADQFLQIADKLLKRATRLYTGKQQAGLTADGVTVRFDGDTLADCMNRAVLCSRLFIKLADSAYHKRRQAKQFALRMKAAGLELTENSTDELAAKQLKRLMQLTGVNQILVQAQETLITDLQGKHQLKAFEAGEEDTKNADIKAHFVGALAAEVEEELSNLEKRILERKKPTEESGQ